MIEKLQLQDSAPWKQRIRAPTIWFTQIASRAPTRGIAATTQTGTLQWYAWDPSTGALRQLTDRPGGATPFTYLSPDGRYVYYLDDSGGNEIGHYVRMPYEGGEIQDLTPDLPPYSSSGFGLSESGTRLGLMAADKEGFALYTIDVDATGKFGAPRRVYHTSSLLSQAMLTPEGAQIVTMSSERTGKPVYSLLAFDAITGDRIGELWEETGSSLKLLRASRVPGDARVLATTDRTGTETLLLWNPVTGERIDLHFEGVEGAILACDWSADGERILFCATNRAVQQFYVHRLSTGATTRLPSYPGTHWMPYFAPDGKEIISHWDDASTPRRAVALDAATGAPVRTLLQAGEVPPGHAWNSVSFRSSDGQEIQAWLGLPEGAGPFPTILETHGGPATVMLNAYAPRAQAWLDHGFAYLHVNYRGSTSFGREFERKIWGQPGNWEVQDMVAARDWLVKEGIARPEAILLTGGSYGAYLTLLALGMHPDLWAGGMAIAAIADWAALYEEEAETLRGYQRILFGGTPEDKPEQYKQSSPITYAEAVRAPVLIIQGRNDTRTPPRQVEEYEARLKFLGKALQVDWYDSGHPGVSTDVEEVIRQQEMGLKFAAQILSEKQTRVAAQSTEE